MRHIQEVMVLGAPLLAGLISEFFMYLSDSAMVGRLGTEYLAAMAIAVMVAEIMWIIIWPLAPATQTIASQKYGRATAIDQKDGHEYKKQLISTGNVFNNSLVIALGASIVAVLLAGLCKPFLSLVLDDPSLIPLIDSYVHIVKWAMPVAGVFYGLYGFLAAINLTIPIMIATIGLNVLNIGFNYILIFGKFGCPALGIEGAALGTVLAQIAGTIYLVAYVLVSRNLRQYKCFRIKGFNPEILKTLIKAGTPITGHLVVVFVIYLYYETLIANLGTVYLAATHIVFTVFILKRTIVGGFAEGGSILIGNNLGRQNRAEAVRYAFAAEGIGIVIGLFLFMLIIIFPEKIVSVFNNDTETIAVGTDALRFFAVFMLIDVIGYPFEVIFTHNGWSRFVFFAGIGTNLIFLLGLSLVFLNVLGLGIYAAWSAFAIQIVVYMAILTAGFFSKKWLDVEVLA
ncbi:MAG: MATE family efflux transporter [Deltaproteobacteria bacterium]|nr:MATE family efflux transporter [Deltaproteobacteria bacterium]